MLYHSHCNLTNNTFPAALLPSKACDYQPHSPTVKSSNDRLLVKVKRFRENLFEIDQNGKYPRRWTRPTVIGGKTDLLVLYRLIF